MRFCGKLFKTLCVGLLLFVPYVRAAEIDILESRLSVMEKDCILSAEFSIPFNARLEDAVKKGVVFHFILDFKLGRPRWYWKNEEIIRESKTFRLSYHILTRQYQLSADEVQWQFVSLDEALQTISNVHDWRVRCKEGVDPKRTYEAALQMRLDLFSMPRTFQIDAFSGESWSLSSDWKRWKFDLPEPEKENAISVEMPAPPAAAATDSPPPPPP